MEFSFWKVLELSKSFFPNPRVLKTIGSSPLPLFQKNLRICNYSAKPAVKLYNCCTAQAQNLFFKNAFSVTLTYKGLQAKLEHPPLYKRGVSFFANAVINNWLPAIHIFLYYTKTHIFYWHLSAPVNPLKTKYLQHKDTKCCCTGGAVGGNIFGGDKRMTSFGRMSSVCTLGGLHPVVFYVVRRGRLFKKEHLPSPFGRASKPL